MNRFEKNKSSSLLTNHIDPIVAARIGTPELMDLVMCVARLFNDNEHSRSFVSEVMQHIDVHRLHRTHAEVCSLSSHTRLRGSQIYCAIYIERLRGNDAVLNPQMLALDMRRHLNMLELNCTENYT